MTNHDESTQDEPVTDSPAPVRRPSRGVIALDAVLLGAMAGVLVWLIADYPEDPGWFDRLGIFSYTALTAFYLWALVKLLRRRWAKAPVAPSSPSGYVDRDGDRWNVRPDGSMAFANGNGGVWELDVVEREFGPLTPVND